MSAKIARKNSLYNAITNYVTEKGPNYREILPILTLTVRESTGLTGGQSPVVTMLKNALVWRYEFEHSVNRILGENGQLCMSIVDLIH